MNTVRVRAIVLRRTNYGEADRILQLLTPLGKRSVMARGVRREKSKLAGGVELFAITDVMINEGRGELGTLTSARLVQFYRHILEDYDTMQFAYEAIKLVTRASEMVDEPEWYDTLSEVFAALDTLTISRQLIQTWFYLRYAALMGHELSLQHDVDGNKLLADQTYAYDQDEKGLRQSLSGELTTGHIKFLRLVQAKSLKVLTQVGGTDTILPGCLQVAWQHAAVK